MTTTAKARTYQDADSTPFRTLANYPEAELRAEIALCDEGMGVTIGHKKRQRYREYRARLWAELNRRESAI